MRCRSLFFLITVLLFSSCRKEEFVDQSKSLNYYYSEDKSKILYDSTVRVTSFYLGSQYRDVPADVTSFEVISTKFAKDKKHLFYTNIPLINADRESFYWDDKNRLPKDKNHVYLPDTKSNKLIVIKNADSKTYEKHILDENCLNWYKDKRHYFYDHKITDADRESMNFESPFLPFDKTYVFWVDDNEVNKKKYIGSVTVINKNMIHDDKSLYFKEGCEKKISIIPFDDMDTFEFYSTVYHIFKIDNKVYYAGILIKEADPETFQILNSKYSKDKNHVYKDGAILEGYKPENFKSDGSGRYPTDEDYGKPSRQRYKSRDDDD